MRCYEVLVCLIECDSLTEMLCVIGERIGFGFFEDQYGILVGADRCEVEDNPLKSIGCQGVRI